MAESRYYDDMNSKKYKVLEPILQNINRKCISYSPEKERAIKAYLEKLVLIVIEEMKRVDVMFNNMYSRIFYSGSSYDGLKITKPDEFDLNLLLTLPKALKFTIVPSEVIPGFVKLRIDNCENLGQEYRCLHKCLDDDNLLIPEKFRSWFEGVIHRACLSIRTHTFSVHKSGPAFTLIFEYEDDEISADLVPALVFSDQFWPSGFRQNPVSQQKNFFIVPKDPTGVNPNHSKILWRLSFQAQENSLLTGYNRLKYVIRLLKRLRDVQRHDLIASYYIKTVVLWMKEERTIDDSFWQKSLSNVFMTTLKYYQKRLEEGKIPYYWNKKFNLLYNRKEITISNWSNRIQHIIDKIERNLDSADDLKDLMNNFFGVTPEEECALRCETDNPDDRSWCVLS